MLFDVCIVNLYEGSYFHMSPEKAFEKAEKEKNDNYIQTCMDCLHYFAILVFLVMEHQEQRYRPDEWPHILDLS